MKTGKKIVSMGLAVCCLISMASLSVRAEDRWPEEEVEIASAAAVVMDADTGTVLYEKNAHDQKYPASITKIMTGLLAIENSQMDEEVVFSEDSVYKTEGSGIWRDIGEVMTMEQTLYALILNSANECAYAIAEHVGGGDYQTFIDMMNDRAREIGCQDTHFTNPHGLPDDDHYTTAYDMALIAREAWKNETFRQIDETLRYEIPPTNKHDEITYLIHQHKMLWSDEEAYYEYCVGGKTGFTDDALNTLVTYAEKDGMTLICVTLKGNKTHYDDTRALLDYCFDNFHAVNIAENLKQETGIEGLSEEYLSSDSFADMDENAHLILPNGVEYEDTEKKISYQEEEGNSIAIIQYTYGDRVVGSVSLTAHQSEIEESSFQEIKVPEVPKIEKMNEEEKENATGFKPWYILLILLGCALLAGIAFGIYKIKEKSLSLHSQYHYNERKQKNVLIKKQRRRRRGRR